MKIKRKLLSPRHGAPFMYAKMAFGLMNAGATFQHAMDIAFAGEIGKFVVIYMDDITVYSRSDREHIHHLEKNFINAGNLVYH